MATKKKEEPQELGGLTGRGVEPLKLPKLDTAIRKYEDAKNARCEESPKELTAKKELRFLLQQYRNELPANAEGTKFYRSVTMEKDYLLEEKLAVKAIAGPEDDDE